MSVWTERIESSQILVRLRELGPAIDKALGRDDNEVEDVESLERIRIVLTLIGKRIDAADGHLMIASNLESVAGAIANVTAYVRGFAEDGVQDQLTNANNAIDSVLPSVADFVLPTTAEDLAGLREAATSYRGSMARELELWAKSTVRASADLDELNKKINTLGEQLTTETDRLNGAVTDVKNNADSVQTQLGQVHEAATTKLEADNATKLGEWQGQFDSAEKARIDADKAAAGARKAAFDETNAHYLSALNESAESWRKHRAEVTEADKTAQDQLQKQYEEKAAAMIAKIDAHLTEASELVDVIADRAVTSGHKQAADHARTQVILWQIVTVVSMLVLVAFAGATALDYFVPAEFNGLSFARRVYFSIAVGILAAYGASQANRYQQIERRNRKLELELKALEPFLKQVSPEQREPFRLKMAEAFFGRDEAGTHEAGPTNLLQVLKSKEHLESLADAAKIVVDRWKK